MIVGVPKEVKVFEFRVGLTPEGARRLVEEGHVVLIEKGAGVGSSFSDTDYRKAGARILESKTEVWKKAELIVKVKEPIAPEFSFFRPGLILFCYLHLAPNPDLQKALQKKKVTAIAYELVQSIDGRFPLLTPMSEIAGLLAPMIGANYLRKDLGGKGVLLSVVGKGGTGHVTIIGAGMVGTNALKIAHGLGASVSVYDIQTQKLEGLSKQYSERLQTTSNIQDLPEIIRRTDVLIGAVLVSGKKTPRVVTKKMVQLMEPGSVVIDVAVDQGGCVETIHPTTHKDPIYKKYGVLHYGVTNMPSLVSRTATHSLCLASLPYVSKIAGMGIERSFQEDGGLKKAAIF